MFSIIPFTSFYTITFADPPAESSLRLFLAVGKDKENACNPADAIVRSVSLYVSVIEATLILQNWIRAVQFGTFSAETGSIDTMMALFNASPMSSNHPNSRTSNTGNYPIHANALPTPSKNRLEKN
jgi:hypothetical protein